jgi:hypothetical protein
MGPAAAVTRSAVTRGSYRRLVQPLVAGGTAVTDLLLSAMRRPQGRYFPGLAVLARHRLRPGATVPLPGVRALVAGAAAHAMMPLNVPPAGGVGLRRVSGSVSAGEQIPIRARLGQPARQPGYAHISARRAAGGRLRRAR